MAIPVTMIPRNTAVAREAEGLVGRRAQCQRCWARRTRVYFRPSGGRSALLRGRIPEVDGSSHLRGAGVNPPAVPNDACRKARPSRRWGRVLGQSK